MSTLIAPAAFMALVTIAMYVAAAATSILALRRGVLSPEAARRSSLARDLPEWVERPRRMCVSLTEMPVLFYAVIALEVASGRAHDPGMLGLAWIYVALRIVHFTIFLKWNPMPWRSIVFASSAAVLATMWVRALLSAG
jgi:hypothetical protein